MKTTSFVAAALLAVGSDALYVSSFLPVTPERGVRSVFRVGRLCLYSIARGLFPSHGHLLSNPSFTLAPLFLLSQH